MAEQNVADRFVDILARAGAKRLYGAVGDRLNPALDAVRPDSAIAWVHLPHSATACAAGAEAQISGRLTACTGPRGPGSLRLLDGRDDTHRSMVPVLALASPIPSSEIGLGHHTIELTQPRAHSPASRFRPPAPASGAAAGHPAGDRPQRRERPLVVRRRRRPARPGRLARTVLVTSRPDVRAADAETGRLVTTDPGLPNLWGARSLSRNGRRARSLSRNGRRRTIGSCSHDGTAGALPRAIGAPFPYRRRQTGQMPGGRETALLMNNSPPLSAELTGFARSASTTELRHMPRP